MLSFVSALIGPLAVFALGMDVQTDKAEAPAPTAIERALMDRACIGTETTSAESYAHRECIDAKLLSLRADFGHDLSRLSAADRRRIDAACNRLRATDQREAYLDCLSGQLTAVHNRQNRGKPTAMEEAAVAPAARQTPDVVAAPPRRPASSAASIAAIGGTVGGVLAAAGCVLLKLRPRRAVRPCRVCGIAVPDSDLCPTCRHEAAEALRRAALERAQTQKAQEEEARRQREQEAEQRELKARDEEEARLREEATARQRQAEEEIERRSHAAAVPPVAAVLTAEVRRDDIFDPYAVLGVPCEACQEDIRIAYQQALTKYDPELVSYLGDEAQAHFREKAHTIERAYQMLAGSRS